MSQNQSFDAREDFLEAQDRAVEFLGEDARAAFITKTYMHLAGAVAFFIGLEVAIFNSPFIDKIVGLPPLLLFGGFMVGGWIFSRMAHTVRSLPLQYVALVAFVAVEAIFFAPLLAYANYYAPGALSAAGYTTAFAFLALTMIAFFTRKDFSFLRPFLFYGGICALIAIVAGAVFGFSLGILFCFAMVVFAGAAVLYDTSNVIHHFPEDRYVGAALELFASVALLFWYILRIFLSFSND